MGRGTEIRPLQQEQAVLGRQKASQNPTLGGCPQAETFLVAAAESHLGRGWLQVSWTHAGLGFGS